MTPEELIASGKLELYVYGSLTKEEQDEIYALAVEHKIIMEEIEAIEAALFRLSSYGMPYLSARNYERIKAAIKLGSRNVFTIRQKVVMYTGYAAAILLLVSLGLINNKYQSTKRNYNTIYTVKNELQETLVKVTNEKNLINELRESKYDRVTLAGQAVSPESSANVYWDQESNQVVVDVQNLPTPPPGKVYQVWSLTFDPLTPVSIGVLDQFTSVDIKIFSVENVSNAQAFGITLEPEGGSPTPTMDQLYTLGKV